MQYGTRWCLVAAAVTITLYATANVQAQQSVMTFFITSVGSGKGGDLGGLTGADHHCQALAQVVGAGHRTWHAYLSTSATGDQPAVNARDRIGRGPWQNAHGVVIARDIDELHEHNNLTKQTALTELGTMVNGRGDTPNRHDILTGSQPDGRAFPGPDELGEDMTCHNWTSSGEGAAMVGHHDRRGLFDTDSARSWNAAHPSRGPNGGCSQEALQSTGGHGFFYCFAVH
jgi:hypothetical protein